MEPKAVFKLIVRWRERKFRLPALLKSYTLGYFSGLVTIEDFMRSGLADHSEIEYFGKRVSFRCFEVKKYLLDYPNKTVGEWVFDGNGKLIGGYNGPEETPFYGRNNNECRFSLGDQVVFLQGKKLLSGEIAGMPNSKVPDKAILDQSDDCYFVKTGSKLENHSHPWVHHVFPEII